MKTLLRGALAAVLVLAALAARAGGLPGPVVDVKWLAANLDRVQVVEVRSNVKSFGAEPVVERDAKSGKRTVAKVGGHIAGSRLVDFDKVRVDRTVDGMTVQYMIPDRPGFEKLMQEAGVVRDRPIVVLSAGTDVASVDEALRLYWQLKVYGEDDVAVLDGGMAQWLVEGQPYTVADAASPAGNWVAKDDRSAQLVATTGEVADAIRAGSSALVDARDARLFNGLAKRDYVYDYGHLESAKLYPTELLLKSVNGAALFMSPTTYRRLMVAQGIDPAAPAITYCNSGHLASGPWFVLSEILGAKKTRLYGGSLQEWTLAKRPLVGGGSTN